MSDRASPSGELNVFRDEEGIVEVVLVEPSVGEKIVVELDYFHYGVALDVNLAAHEIYPHLDVARYVGAYLGNFPFGELLAGMRTNAKNINATRKFRCRVCIGGDILLKYILFYCKLTHRTR